MHLPSITVYTVMPRQDAGPRIIIKVMWVAAAVTQLMEGMINCDDAETLVGTNINMWL